jgi:regulator of extracellular matrix RemA (YlzA/DUF370 family)
MKLVPIGYFNFVNSERIISVSVPDSSPAKRLMKEAQENRMLIDATCGRKTRGVIAMDSGHIVLTAFDTKTIANRIMLVEKKPEIAVSDELNEN